MSKKKVLLGMSGGVDSSVAALLLLKAGYDVTGMTMRLRPDAYMQQSASGGCCSLDDIDDARRVCYQLGIEHLVLNFTEQFERDVIQYFAGQYAAGRTPNPCIACNRHLKFDAMLQKARLLGYDYIATGHYAVIEQNSAGRWLLKKAPASKDQSYVLYSLTQDQLAHTLMPLGAYTKPEARRMAEEAGLRVAHKPDSQEICFVPDGDYAGFIERSMGKQLPTGNFVTAKGEILGKHKGIVHYTIGQRKGLGLSMGHPVFVSGIRPESNEVVIGESEDLFKTVLYAHKLNLMSRERLEGPLRVMAKIRYNHRGAPCTVEPLEEDRIRCVFDTPQRAITPGQAVVLYEGEYVLGGAVITGSEG